MTRINLTSSLVNGSRMAMALPLASPLKRKSLVGLVLGANNQTVYLSAELVSYAGLDPLHGSRTYVRDSKAMLGLVACGISGPNQV